MKRFLSAAMAALLAVCALFTLTGCQSFRKYLVAQAETPETSAGHMLKSDAFIQRAANGFAYRMIAAQSESGEIENTAFAPLSAYFAFSALAETASGNTQKEILNALGVSDLDQSRAAIKALYEDHYFKDGKFGLSLNQSLWINQAQMSRTINQSTLERLTASHYASVYRADFNKKSSAKAVGEWIGNKSRQKFGQDYNLDSAAVAMLLSTVELSDNWSTVFKKQNNIEEFFRNADGGVKQKTFMRQTKTTGYFKSDRFAAASLPMKHAGLRMTFVLPDETVSAHEIAANGRALSEAVATAANGAEGDRAEVHFSIPKFKIRADGSLTGTMKRLGIVQAFAQNAEFGNLGETDAGESLYVADAVQSCEVEINEKGVEGASVIKILYGATAPAPEPLPIVDFKLDRPFLFVVSNTSGIPVFFGVVNLL